MGALKIFNGTTWDTIVSTGVIIASVAPSAPALGQLWYDQTNQILKVWDGASWDSATFSANISQTTLTGGGIRIFVPSNYTSPGISWGSPFTIRAATQLTNEFTTVTMPINGVTITGYGGASGQTVAGGRLPLANGTTLYYDVPSGGSATTDNSRFKIGVAGYTVPRSWVPIATRDDSQVEALTWGDGQSDSGWHYVGSTGEPAFQTGWVNYGIGWVPARFARRGGVVYIEGLVKSGTGVMFTLPVGYRPDLTDSMLWSVVGNNAFARIDVSAAGNVAISVGSNGFMNFNFSYPAFA